MSDLPSSGIIIKALLRNGFVFVSQRGSHRKYQKGEKTVIVPAPKKEIPIVLFVRLCGNREYRRKNLTKPEFRMQITRLYHHGAISSPFPCYFAFRNLLFRPAGAA